MQDPNQKDRKDSPTSRKDPSKDPQSKKQAPEDRKPDTNA